MRRAEPVSAWSYLRSFPLSGMTTTGARAFVEDHKSLMQTWSDSLHGLQDNCLQDLGTSRVALWVVSEAQDSFQGWEMQTGGHLSSPVSLPHRLASVPWRDVEDAWDLTQKTIFWPAHSYTHVTCPATHTKEQDGATDFSSLSLV